MKFSCRVCARFYSQSRILAAAVPFSGQFSPLGDYPIHTATVRCLPPLSVAERSSASKYPCGRTPALQHSGTDVAVRRIREPHAPRTRSTHAPPSTSYVPPCCRHEGDSAPLMASASPRAANSAASSGSRVCRSCNGHVTATSGSRACRSCNGHVTASSGSRACRRGERGGHSWSWGGAGAFFEGLLEVSCNGHVTVM